MYLERSLPKDLQLLKKKKWRILFLAHVAEPAELIIKNEEEEVRYSFDSYSRYKSSTLLASLILQSKGKNMTRLPHRFQVLMFINERKSSFTHWQTD